MEMVADIYSNYMLEYDMTNFMLKELEQHTEKLSNLLMIRESIETYGVDSAVMALINKDDQLVNELGLTKNDLNKSQEGLADTFKTGLGKKILDAIKWIIEKIGMCVKWIFEKLTEWARNVNGQNRFRVAADVWDKIPDSMPVKKNPARQDGAWVEIPDFEACKKRLELSEHICVDFINVFADEFASIVEEYKNNLKNLHTVGGLYDIILRHDKLCKVIAESGTAGGQPGTVLTNTVAAYQIIINKQHLEKDLKGFDKGDQLFWADAKAIPRIAQVEFKRDLRIQYKGEFTEVGVYVERTISAVQKAKPKLQSMQRDLLTIYTEMQRDIQSGNIDQDVINKYNTEMLMIKDLGSAITGVLNTTARHVANCAVANMGLNELMQAIVKMF